MWPGIIATGRPTNASSMDLRCTHALSHWAGRHRHSTNNSPRRQCPYSPHGRRGGGAGCPHRTLLSMPPIRPVSIWIPASWSSSSTKCIRIWGQDSCFYRAQGPVKRVSAWDFHRLQWTWVCGHLTLRVISCLIGPGILIFSCSSWRSYNPIVLPTINSPGINIKRLLFKYDSFVAEFRRLMKFFDGANSSIRMCRDPPGMVIMSKYPSVVFIFFVNSPYKLNIEKCIVSSAYREYEDEICPLPWWSCTLRHCHRKRRNDPRFCSSQQSNRIRLSVNNNIFMLEIESGPRYRTIELPCKCPRCTYHSCQCYTVSHRPPNRPTAQSACPPHPCRTVHRHRGCRNTATTRTASRDTFHCWNWRTAEHGNWADLPRMRPCCRSCIVCARQCRRPPRTRASDDRTGGSASIRRRRIHANIRSTHSNCPSRHRPGPVALQWGCTSDSGTIYACRNVCPAPLAAAASHNHRWPCTTAASKSRPTWSRRGRKRRWCWIGGDIADQHCTLRPPAILDSWTLSSPRVHRRGICPVPDRGNGWCRGGYNSTTTPAPYRPRNWASSHAQWHRRGCHSQSSPYRDTSRNWRRSKREKYLNETWNSVLILPILLMNRIGKNVHWTSLWDHRLLMTKCVLIRGQWAHHHQNANAQMAQKLKKEKKNGKIKNKQTRRVTHLCPSSCVIVCANVMPLSSLTLHERSGLHMPPTFATPSVLYSKSNKYTKWNHQTECRQGNKSKSKSKSKNQYRESAK